MRRSRSFGQCDPLDPTCVDYLPPPDTSTPVDLSTAPTESDVGSGTGTAVDLPTTQVASDTGASPPSFWDNLAAGLTAAIPSATNQLLATAQGATRTPMPSPLLSAGKPASASSGLLGVSQKTWWIVGGIGIATLAGLMLLRRR